MKGQYVIIDLRTMDFMKDENGIIKYYDTEEEAGIVCGVYEHENAWVLKLIYNHILYLTIYNLLVIISRFCWFILLILI
jgi:hypothetical protein